MTRTQNYNDRGSEGSKARERLIVSGTTFNALLPRDHPWRGKYTSESDVIQRAVWKWRRPMSRMGQQICQTGTNFESGIRDAVQDALYAPIYEPGFMVCTVNPWWGGSPDGLVLDTNRDGVTTVRAVVEIKTLVKRQWRFNANGSAEVPGYYMAQAQWYMWMVDCPRCAFAQYRPADDTLHITWIEAEPERMQLALVEVCRRTEQICMLIAQWRNVVATGVVIGLIEPVQGEYLTTGRPALDPLEESDRPWHRWHDWLLLEQGNRRDPDAWDEWERWVTGIIDEHCKPKRKCRRKPLQLMDYATDLGEIPTLTATLDTLPPPPPGF